MNYILETDHLTKKSGSAFRANEVCLRIPERCVYGFLGPNGAGKTTTLKLILGLIRPDGGSVSLFGQPLEAKNRLSLLRQTGSLIESPGGYGHLTVLENMQIVQRLKGIPEEEILSALRTVRMDGHRDRKLRACSLGMKQRLGIAAALLGSPRLLILDEPTNGLDPAGIQEMRELIRTLPQERGMTVLVSSHLLSEVAQMADYIGIIHHGEMRYQGRLSELAQEGESLEDAFLRMTGGRESL